MGFSIYLPHNPTNRPLASILFLGGMTCSDESFFQQAGAIRRASELGLALICPDTSPRNTGIDGEDGCYDLGSGASFYVDATEPKWAKHYNMYSYITHEFRDLIFKEFPLVLYPVDLSNTSRTLNACQFRVILWAAMAHYLLPSATPACSSAARHSRPSAIHPRTSGEGRCLRSI
ncbi:hypothetical protein DSO57_1018435 [Entomophthora muscae]|uniref:Uncharacterized protein n=1 Tax=Entomophthora muscae TaxID=34485 RepID=A0ACC2UEN5_9FUNG|nr:hypothetical protein DSO57_1018435 [Entomophthora muscae]